MRTTKWLVPVLVLALVAVFPQAVKAEEEEPAAPDTPVAPAAVKGIVKVNVVDADAKAVEGAKVLLLAPKETEKVTVTKKCGKGAGKAGKNPPVAEGVTDNEGNVTLSDIEPGSYVVKAVLKGTGVGKAPVTVEAGKTVELKLTLKPKGGKAGKAGKGAEAAE